MVAVEPHVWEDIDVLNPLFENSQEIMNILESDNFGSISFVIRGLSLFQHYVQSLPERFNTGKVDVAAKLRKIWEKYNDLWDPLLFAATRLNPALDVYMILESEQIARGDQYILEMMKTFDSHPKVQSPTKKNNVLCCFGHGKSDSHETVFESYKANQVDDIIDLFDFWKGKLKTKMSTLANVAIQILSILSSSASVEREFSSSRRAIGFQRLRMHPNKVEDMMIIIGNPDIAEIVIK